MKQKTLILAVQKIKSNPRLLRKVKILALLGASGFFVVGGLTIWALISTFNFIASTADQAIKSEYVQERLPNVKAHFDSVPAFDGDSCWIRAKILFDVKPWLEKPAVVNFTSLQQACFKDRPNQPSADEAMRYIF